MLKHKSTLGILAYRLIDEKVDQGEKLRYYKGNSARYGCDRNDKTKCRCEHNCYAGNIILENKWFHYTNHCYFHSNFVVSILLCAILLMIKKRC